MVDIAQNMNHFGHFEHVAFVSCHVEFQSSDNDFLFFYKLPFFFQFDCMVVSVCVLRFQPFLVSVGFNMGVEVGSSVKYVVVAEAAKTLGFIIE